MDDEYINEFSEAEALIGQAERQEQSEAIEPEEGEFIPAAMEPDADPARQSVIGLIRGFMGFLNWVLRLKDDRVQYQEEHIKQAETELAPAMLKHGIGSEGITRFGEEFQAGSFLVQLGVGTRQAFKEVRAMDEEAEKQKRGGAGSEEPERQFT